MRQGVVEHVEQALWRLRQEDKKFRVTLGCIMSYRPAWDGGRAGSSFPLCLCAGRGNFRMPGEQGAHCNIAVTQRCDHKRAEEAFSGSFRGYPGSVGKHLWASPAQRKEWVVRPGLSPELDKRGPGHPGLEDPKNRPWSSMQLAPVRTGLRASPQREGCPAWPSA